MATARKASKPPFIRLAAKFAGGLAEGTDFVVFAMGHEIATAKAPFGGSPTRERHSRQLVIASPVGLSKESFGAHASDDRFELLKGTDGGERAGDRLVIIERSRIHRLSS